MIKEMIPQKKISEAMQVHISAIISLLFVSSPTTKAQLKAAAIEKLQKEDLTN